MFWFLYIFLAFFLSYLITFIFKKDYLVFFTCCIILMTPAQVEVGSISYSPAVFTFLFNILLEQNYSFIALRPLALTLPIGFLVLFLVSIIKKRFF